MTQPINQPLICHFLIGPPGAGKSTLAQQLLAQDPAMVWVSTDNIREELFGNADRQGDWEEISVEVDRQIRRSVAEGKAVIYDATNTQRAWRLDFLEKYASETVVWVGWWLQTSEADCKVYNQTRSRQVPDWVIEKAIADLKRLPPDSAEGFALIKKVKEVNLQELLNTEKIAKLPEEIRKHQTSIVNRASGLKYHAHSRLLDFERLVYLMLVLIRYPGAGNLRETQPDVLAQALKHRSEILPPFPTALAEISEIIKNQYGAVYADANAIAANLDWLQKNGFINSPECQEPLIFQEYVGEFNPLLTHRYTDWDIFRRVMEVTRYLAYAPLFKKSGKKLQAMLVEQFRVYYPQLSWLTEDLFQRDITEFFARYGFWQGTMKQGYFLGAGILPKEDLENLALTLKINTPLHNNPIQSESYLRFQERMALLRRQRWQSSLDSDPKGINTLPEESYPSRTILHRQLSDELSLHTIETYIDQARVLLWSRQPGRGQYGGDVEDSIAILPLQIAFHKIDWYLGYVVIEKGNNEGLLRFDRLARWSLKQYPEEDLGYRQVYQGDKGFQRQRLKDLQALLKVSYSPFIGRNPQEQQQVLSQGKKALKPLELWFADNIFNVVSLATKRFPDLKMSPRSHTTEKERDEVFTLKPTGDKRFPYRLRAKLAPWVLETDFDLEGWILRFGGQVKVVEPLDLAERILRKAQAIGEIYQGSENG